MACAYRLLLYMLIAVFTITQMDAIHTALKHFKDYLKNVLLGSTRKPKIRSSNLFIKRPSAMNIHWGPVFYFCPGGAIRDLLVDEYAKPKDIDLQMTGSTDGILAQLKKHYDEQDISTNQIGIKVGQPTDYMDAIDIRPMLDKYFNLDYIENDINGLLFNLKTDDLIDISGTGILNCTQQKFQISATCMKSWNSFPEPPRVYNGKLIRVLKMLAKGFNFADASQATEFINLFEEFFDAHCALVIVDKFSTFDVVLGQTIRGDTLNFTDGSIKAGNNPLYDKCIEALECLDKEMAKKVVMHMTK